MQRPSSADETIHPFIVYLLQAGFRLTIGALLNINCVLVPSVSVEEFKEPYFQLMVAIGFFIGPNKGKTTGVGKIEHNDEIAIVYVSSCT